MTTLNMSASGPCWVWRLGPSLHQGRGAVGDTGLTDAESEACEMLASRHELSLESVSDRAEMQLVKI
jgi:hypothetical protein